MLSDSLDRSVSERLRQERAEGLPVSISFEECSFGRLTDALTRFRACVSNLSGVPAESLVTMYRYSNNPSDLGSLRAWIAPEPAGLRPTRLVHQFGHMSRPLPHRCARLYVNPSNGVESWIGSPKSPCKGWPS